MRSARAIRTTALAATERARGLGADIVTTEMVIFEWLGTSEHPKFRRCSQLVR